jgi:drug/metabolite transporter (DMT)-like permease
MGKLSVLIPLLLTVCGGVLYHLGVKAVPKGTDPALALASAYAMALCASVVAYWVVPTAADPAPIAPWHPAVLAVGLGVVMIGLGYLLTYRAAWPVSVASLLTNVLVALLLVPIGVALFDERFSAARGLGVTLCIVGVLLLKR